jgi:hypothetical protein
MILEVSRLRATVEGEQIGLGDLTLDDLGWDRADREGSEALELSLDGDELLEVGRILYDYARECVAEESDYFTSQPEIPVPSSGRLFVEEPARLAEYLRDPFWSREAILAIFTAGGVPRDPARYAIRNLRGWARTSYGVSLEFGAAAGE